MERIVTGDLPMGDELLQFRCLSGASGPGSRAALTVGTSCRICGQLWITTGSMDWRSDPIVCPGIGHSGQQGGRVRVQRAAVEMHGGGDFAQYSLEHHRHPVADIFYHPQIMGDKEHRQTVATSYMSQQVQYLGLHRDVQGADRLIAYQQLGRCDQCPGDADALTLAAGKFKRSAVKGV